MFQFGGMPQRPTNWFAWNVLETLAATPAGGIPNRRSEP